MQKPPSIGGLEHPTSSPGWPWKHPVGPDKLCHDVTIHISCPSILTLNHTFHLPFSISFFWMPSFRKFLVYSAVLPPKPLLWTILGW